jgi:acyl-CoA synthetase (AMP-forming)/AMP-acid ligase II
MVDERVCRVSGIALCMQHVEAAWHHAARCPPCLAVMNDTILDAFESHVAKRPSQVAFRFLADGDNESAAWTYADLRSRALVVAACLEEHTQPGDRALLLFPPGLDIVAAFLGCLYAHVIAVPLYAPHRRRHDPRLTGIAADSTPRVLISTADVLTRCADVIHDVAPTASASLAIDMLTSGRHPSRQRPAENQIAFIQYTSGSTTEPRGVCVTHANLVANQRMIQRAMALDEHTVCVSWLPAHHDMGLIGDILGIVLSGGSCVRLPPAAFVQHPIRWLRAAASYRATLIGGPNFAYDHCAHHTTPAERQHLDLSDISVAYCGSEPIRSSTLDAFGDAFACTGFRPESWLPCYGLAEATLFVSGTRGKPRIRPWDASSSRGRGRVTVPTRDTRGATLLSCGPPAEGTEVVIVNPATSECSPGEVGEVWVRGPHVSAGYWKRPTLTEATMRARLADGRGPFLRTGDCGFTDGGELFVVGRLKDVVVVRGRNLYAHDIEFTASGAHPLLRGETAACFGATEDEAESFVVVLEMPRTTPPAVAAAARAAVIRDITSAYQAAPKDVAIVRRGSIPRTTSGKVRRFAARDSYLKSALPRLDVVGDWDAEETPA